MANRSKLTHLNAKGAAHMVDVGGKPATRREAIATAQVRVGREVLTLIANRGVPKGDVFAVARIAGITAAKRTAELIPLCHPLPIESVEIELKIQQPDKVLVTAKAGVVAKTGIEMEALTAAAVAALTVYDMCKAITKDIEIGPIRLERKSGGKSGTYERKRRKVKTSKRRNSK